MKIWTKIHELFAATAAEAHPEPNVVWAEEFDRLRKLRVQRIELAAKQTRHFSEIIALPVREM